MASGALPLGTLVWLKLDSFAVHWPAIVTEENKALLSLDLNPTLTPQIPGENEVFIQWLDSGEVGVHSLEEIACINFKDGLSNGKHDFETEWTKKLKSTKWDYLYPNILKRFQRAVENGKLLRTGGVLVKDRDQVDTPPWMCVKLKCKQCRTNYLSVKKHTCKLTLAARPRQGIPSAPPSSRKSPTPLQGAMVARGMEGDYGKRIAPRPRKKVVCSDDEADLVLDVGSDCSSPLAIAPATSTNANDAPVSGVDESDQDRIHDSLVISKCINEHLFHHAISQDQLPDGDIVWLLEHGARCVIQSPDDQGKVPLHYAAIHGRTVVCHLLKKTDPSLDLNIKLPPENFTALHLAAMYGRIDTVKALLELGADRNAQTVKRKTPSDIASEEIKRVLDGYGKKMKRPRMDDDMF